MYESAYDCTNYAVQNRRYIVKDLNHISLNFVLQYFKGKTIYLVMFKVIDIAIVMDKVMDIL